MEQITVFGDIHANLMALEAVFADMQARETMNVYCLGDLVGYGIFPNEVVAAIQARNIHTIRRDHPGFIRATVRGLG